MTGLYAFSADESMCKAGRGRSAVGGYSGNAVKPIALRFIAEMGQNPVLKGLHISGMVVF